MNRLSLIISRKKGQHCDRGTVSPSAAALLNISCIKRTVHLQSWSRERCLPHNIIAKLEVVG